MDIPKAISLLHRKMNTELNERLKKIGLSHAKSRLLKHLYLNGEKTQADLCKELELDKSTVAKALVRMESNGLIIKHIKPDDTRSHLISLTPKAIHIIPQAQEILSSWSNDVTSGMTQDEKELFYKLIDKVAHQAANICKE